MPPVPTKRNPIVRKSHRGSTDGKSFTSANPTAIDDSPVLSQAANVRSLANRVRSRAQMDAASASSWEIVSSLLFIRSMLSTLGGFKAAASNPSTLRSVPTNVRPEKGMSTKSHHIMWTFLTDKDESIECITSSYIKRSDINLAQYMVHKRT